MNNPAIRQSNLSSVGPKTRATAHGFTSMMNLSSKPPLVSKQTNPWSKLRASLPSQQLPLGVNRSVSGTPLNGPSKLAELIKKHKTELGTILEKENESSKSSRNSKLRVIKVPKDALGSSQTLQSQAHRCIL